MPNNVESEVRGFVRQLQEPTAAIEVWGCRLRNRGSKQRGKRILLLANMCLGVEL